MSPSVNTVKMLCRARFAVLDRLLTELEEVNPGPCASHVPMDLLRQLDAHDIGGARQARQRPQPAARGGAAEACQVGAAAAELLGAVGEGSEVGPRQGLTVSPSRPKSETRPRDLRE
jgi:hypothetical protein